MGYLSRKTTAGIKINKNAIEKLKKYTTVEYKGLYRKLIKLFRAQPVEIKRGIVTLSEYYSAWSFDIASNAHYIKLYVNGDHIADIREGKVTPLAGYELEIYLSEDQTWVDIYMNKKG